MCPFPTSGLPTNMYIDDHWCFLFKKISASALNFEANSILVGGEDETKRLQAIFRYLDPGGLDLQNRLWCFLQSLCSLRWRKHFFGWMASTGTTMEWICRVSRVPSWRLPSILGMFWVVKLWRFRTRMQVRLPLSGSAASIVDVLSNMNMMCTNLQCKHVFTNTKHTNCEL